MMKLQGQNWPVKVLSTSSNEIRKVVVFNDSETELNVAQHNLKPFTVLKRVPRKSEEWIRGYKKALAIFEENY